MKISKLLEYKMWWQNGGFYVTGLAACTAHPVTLFSIFRAMPSYDSPLDKYFSKQAASVPWQFPSDAMFALETFIILCDDMESFPVI